MDDDRKRTWAIRVIFVLLTLEVIGFGGFVPAFGYLTVGRVMLAVIVVLVGLVVLRPLDQKRVDDFHRKLLDAGTKFQVKPVGQDQVQELQKQAGKLKIIDAWQAKIFALSITAPAELRKRVIDTYRLDERTIRQRVTIEGCIPGRFYQNGEPKLIYLPALVPPKGKLLDDWRIADASGTELPGLTYRESLLVVVSVLRTLLAAACKGQDNLQDKLTAQAIEVEKRAIRLLIAREPDDALDVDNVESVIADIEALPDLIGGDPATAQAAKFSKKMAAVFVRKMSRNYAIIAPVKPNEDHRFIFSYEQTLIPDLEVHKSRAKWVEALIGSPTVALGARPIDITIGINNASTCQSYHLVVDGSEGVWLGDQEPLGMERTLGKMARGAPTPPHSRFRKRLGQSYGHFYVRYFPEPEVDENPRIRFQYFEVPPGSLLRAGVAAIASFLLVWVIGAVTTMRPDSMSIGSDAPAILLAFPAIAAAWIGFEKKDRKLLEGTLAARACLMITAAVSISAAALFMAHSVLAQYHFRWWRLPNDSSILWVKDDLWALLVLIALANALVVSYKYVVNTWEYWKLSSRAQVNNEATRRS